MDKTLREKLSNISEYITVSDESIVLCKFLSEVISDDVEPEDLALAISIIQHDISVKKRGKNSYKKDQEDFKYLVRNRSQVLVQTVYFPQIIDQVTSPKFAKEFRGICNIVFTIDPPKIPEFEKESKYPEYIEKAVNWWAVAILAPRLDAKLDDIDLSTYLLTSIAKRTKKYTAEQIQLFMDALASQIENDISEYGSSNITVDYSPCPKLAAAGQLLSIDELTGYPWKTTMIVRPEKITLEQSYGKEKVIWKKETM